MKEARLTGMVPGTGMGQKMAANSPTNTFRYQDGDR